MSALVTDPQTVARAALLEITKPTDVGDLLDETLGDDGVTTLHFAATMLGYPGWRWTVSVAQVAGDAPTVLEAELLPGDGALLAPDWVPWSDRLEEWTAQQAVDSTDDDAEDDDESDDDDDADDDSDDDDHDDFGDDVYDGLDPESAAAAESEHDESEHDESASDEGGDDDSDEGDDSDEDADDEGDPDAETLREY